MKRELASSCTYVHQGVRNASAQVQKPGGGCKDVRERVQHLERLVIDLMDKITQQELSLVLNKPCEPGLRILDRSSNGIPLIGSERTSQKVTAEMLGRVSIEDNRSNYVGGAHWAEILDHVSYAAFGSILSH